MAKENNLIIGLVKTLVISGVASFGAWYGINKYQNHRMSELEYELRMLNTENNIIKNHNDQVSADMDVFLSSVQLNYDELHILLDIDQKLNASNALPDRYIYPKADISNTSTIRKNHDIPENMGIATIELDVDFSTLTDMYTFLDSLKPENSEVLYTIDYLNINEISGQYNVDITLINYYYDTLLDTYTSIFSSGIASYQGMFEKDVENGIFTFQKLIDESTKNQLSKNKYVNDYSLTKSTIKYENGIYYLTLYEKNDYFAVIINKQYNEISNCTNLLDLRA